MNIAQNLPSIDLPFDNSYARLPEQFYARQLPTEMPSPSLIRFNQDLAREMGIDGLDLESPTGIGIFGGNVIPPSAEPIAMVYAGHQFGGYAPRLGDGRAVLLGEIVGPDGVRRDLQLKGAGRTPFSRGGDGRAVLGPVLREYIVSEAMHALGIPTTRALAATLTGEQVAREQYFPGAMLTRVARSHVRVGTFQYFSAQGDHDSVRQLADYVIERHYPETAESEHPYDALFEAIMEAQATLVSKWMMVGFIHGVMNTDNMQVAGETIDYGPCAFMDTYDPATVYSSIDRMGRYAYRNQPRIAQWNLAWILRAFLPFMDENQEAAVERAQATIDRYPALYEEKWLAGMRDKLGLAEAREEDLGLVQDLHEVMHEQEADFTNTFRALSRLGMRKSAEDEAFMGQFKDPESVDGWLRNWRSRLKVEDSRTPLRRKRMLATNPAIIPRNHLVEAAIQAGLAGDFSVFENLHVALRTPFEEPADHDHFMAPPRAEEVVQQTFCGT